MFVFVPNAPTWISTFPTVVGTEFTKKEFEFAVYADVVIMIDDLNWDDPLTTRENPGNCAEVPTLSCPDCVIRIVSPNAVFEKPMTFDAGFVIVPPEERDTDAAPMIVYPEIFTFAFAGYRAHAVRPPDISMKFPRR